MLVRRKQITLCQKNPCLVQIEDSLSAWWEAILSGRETQNDLLCTVIVLAHGVHDMLKSRVKARRVTREGTTAKVNLELILAYPRVVAVEEHEVTGFKVDALAQVKAD